jgi:hypothetical protein
MRPQNLGRPLHLVPRGQTVEAITWLPEPIRLWYGPREQGESRLGYDAPEHRVVVVGYDARYPIPSWLRDAL